MIKEQGDEDGTAGADADDTTVSALNGDTGWVDKALV